MDPLYDIRKYINEVDDRIIELLGFRTQAVTQVGEYKRAHNLPVYVPEREREVVARLQSLGREKGVDPELVREVYELIFKNSRQLQTKN